MNRKLILISFFLPLFYGCSEPADQNKKTEDGIYLTDSLKQIISIDTVYLQDVASELTLNGRVTFNQEQVARVYPIFGGMVTEINAETGDYVRKGDILAIIKSGEVADYEKQLKEAEQQILITQRALASVQDMYTAGMASERDILQAKQEWITAEAEKNRLKEISSIYNLSGNSFYQIKSPVSGFIVNKDISKNMQIRSDQEEELFTVTSLQDVWVMADVYESDISKIHEGDEVTITTLAYKDKVFKGNIDKVYQVLNDESKTMSVRIKLYNEDYLLKPGMFAKVIVTCQVSEEQMARINSHALVFENEKYYVVAIDTDNQLCIQEVDIYKQLNEKCYIRAGITAGDRILNKNVLLIYNALSDN